jgi:choline dehydrogenase
VAYTHTHFEQKALQNRVHAWPRGKGLGGSSAINFMMFSQASKGDLDNWAKLGNNGWGWDDMQEYYRKFETYIPATADVAKRLKVAYPDAKLRGTHGPVKTSFSAPDVNWMYEVINYREICDRLKHAHET